MILLIIIILSLETIPLSLFNSYFNRNKFHLLIITCPQAGQIYMAIGATSLSFLGMLYQIDLRISYSPSIFVQYCLWSFAATFLVIFLYKSDLAVADSFNWHSQLNDLELIFLKTFPKKDCILSFIFTKLLFFKLKNDYMIFHDLYTI